MFLSGWSIQRRIDSMMHQGCADVIVYLSLREIYFPPSDGEGAELDLMEGDASGQ